MPRRTLPAALLSSGLLAVVAAASAHAEGVAYLKGGEVWASSLDGSTKVQLSAGEGGWNAVGQSASGAIVATRRAPGAAAAATTFTIWNGKGAVADSGPASPGTFATGLAMPMSLDLAKTNRLVVYGFANTVSGVTANGYTLLPAATRVVPVGTTYTGSAIRYPTLAAERLLGTADGQTISIQDTGGYGSKTFSPWISFSSVIGVSVRAAHASDDGTVVGVELATDNPDPAPDTERIAMVPTGGFGAPLQAGDCFLPASGPAASADVSADGATVAWADADGLKVGGRPDFSGADPCALTRAAQLIQVGATDPALGPVDVAALAAARTRLAAQGGVLTPAPGAGPTVAVPSPLRVAALRRGAVRVRVGVGRAGAVAVVLRLGGRKLAGGTAAAPDAGQVTVALKPAAAGRRGGLTGRTATLRVTGGGRTLSRAALLR